MNSSFSTFDLPPSLQTSEVPVLIDVGHPHCDDCRGVRSRIERLKERMGSQMKIGHLTVRENMDIIHALEIKRVPTLLVFRNGTLSARLHGRWEIQRFADRLESEGEPVG